METLRKLELALAEQYKKAPHLPAGGQKWLAENAWWLVVIGVVLSVFGLLGILGVLAVAIFGLSLGGAALGAGYGAAVGAAIGGILLISTLLYLALYIVETVILGLAITPLKSLQKRGWDLVFLVMVLNVAIMIVTDLLSFNLIAIVVGLLWAAVGGYFLFEIRDRFVTKKVAAKTPKATAKAKA